jgi:hypothetical protein
VLHFVGGVADDDGDIADAGVTDGFDAVEQDRLVRDGNELLGAGVGDGPQPRALPAGEDQCFDGGSLPFASPVSCG